MSAKQPLVTVDAQRVPSQAHATTPLEQAPTAFSRPAALLALQRTIGNHAVGRVLAQAAPALPSMMQRIGLVQTQKNEPGGDTSTTPSPAQRVEAAIAANNMDALIAIQRELRQQMLTDPLHPPPEARVGLATARHLTMDRIAAIRDTYAPLIEAAQTGASTGVDKHWPY